MCISSSIYNASAASDKLFYAYIAAASASFLSMFGIRCSTDKMLHRTTIHTMHDKGTSVIAIVPR